MYFIGLLIMTSGDGGGVRSIMSSWEGGLHTVIPCASQKSCRRHLEHPHQELAHPGPGQGTWQQADGRRAAWLPPDPDPAPVSSGFAFWLPSSAFIGQLLILGNKRAGTEEFKFCIHVSKTETIALPCPLMLARPGPSPSPAPGDARPQSDWSKSDTREPDPR